MSEPEFYIKDNDYVDDIVNDVQDMLWRTEGKMTAQNTGSDNCPGGLPISSCDTTKNLMSDLIETDIEPVEHKSLDEKYLELFRTGGKLRVEQYCGDCRFTSHLPHEISKTPVIV